MSHRNSLDFPRPSQVKATLVPLKTSSDSDASSPDDQATQPPQVEITGENGTQSNYNELVPEGFLLAEATLVPVRTSSDSDTSSPDDQPGQPPHTPQVEITGEGDSLSTSDELMRHEPEILSRLRAEQDFDDTKSNCSSVRSFGSMEDLDMINNGEIQTESEADQTLQHNASALSNLNSSTDDNNDDTILSERSSEAQDRENSSNGSNNIPSESIDSEPIIGAPSEPDSNQLQAEPVITQCVEDVEKDPGDQYPPDPALEQPILTEFDVTEVEAEQVVVPDEPLGAQSMIVPQPDTAVQTSNEGTLLLVLTSGPRGERVAKPFPSYNSTYVRGCNDDDTNNVSH